MKVLTVGCGAVGAYFCGRLAQHGAEVSVTLRSDYDEVKRNGFNIRSIAGDFVFRPYRVLRDASEYGETPDYLVLTSKVLPEIDRAGMIRAAVRQGTVIVLIQNGIGIEDELANAFPDNEILSAIAYIGVTRTGHGKIVHGGAGRLTLGRFGGGTSASGEKLCADFDAAGCRAEYTEDIAYYRWVKLLWNLPFNPVSVLGGGLETCDMTDGQETEKLCADLMREVIAIARSCGVGLPEKLIAENMEFTRNFPPYKTSMLIDFENGRRMEVEAIVGNALRLARRNGVAVPKTEAVYALLNAVQKTAAGKRLKVGDAPKPL